MPSHLDCASRGDVAGKEKSFLVRFYGKLLGDPPPFKMLPSNRPAGIRSIHPQQVICHHAPAKPSGWSLAYIDSMDSFLPPQPNPAGPED